MLVHQTHAKMVDVVLRLAIPSIVSVLVYSLDKRVTELTRQPYVSITLAWHRMSVGSRFLLKRDIHVTVLREVHA
ncbi:hypothetical protein, partial [Salmonella sp. s51944]|uniref:hypothetical protein n=1 Tax=Salmonella sp. s51944 TaxID=3159655 RepID=UPI00397F2064